MVRKVHKRWWEGAMVSDERLRELEEKYEGYTVVDDSGDKIGKVDDLLVDDVDNEEYIGVKMGLFGLSGMTLIPMELCRADEPGRRIQVHDTKEHVKAAPNFRDDDDITAEYEDRIREHFGLSGAAPSSDRGFYGRYEAPRASGGYREEGREDERYSGRPEGGVQARGVSSPDTTDLGRPDDERYSGLAMGGVNRKEQAEPRGAEPGYETAGEERREPADRETHDEGTPFAGAASSFGAGSPEGAGEQRNDYDRGYDEGYRRAMEKLRSSGAGEGSGGIARERDEGGPGATDAGSGRESERTRVRRRIRRLT
jgi:hypothetical protein